MYIIESLGNRYLVFYHFTRTDIVGDCVSNQEVHVHV